MGVNLRIQMLTTEPFVSFRFRAIIAAMQAFNTEQPRIVFLMGPTAAGKTPLAIKLVQQFPFEIISVDSAMVYRGLNIGSAKPDAPTLQMAPHRLIDICDPTETYSAGRFRGDALREISDIHARGKIPLLVGGTMLYFRVLQQGIAHLPSADKTIRDELFARAQKIGWQALHTELAEKDPVAAARIHPQDQQRIQRALEVYALTGQSISAQQRSQTNPLNTYRILSLAIAPSDRAQLHERIKLRFTQMLADGFVEEVQQLMARGDLSLDKPALRSVGYRQIWEYLLGQSDYQTMTEKALAATRQLAKRQMTWLRSWPDLQWLAVEDPNLFDNVMKKLGFLGKEEY